MKRVAAIAVAGILAAAIFFWAWSSEERVEATPDAPSVVPTEPIVPAAAIEPPPSPAAVLAPALDAGIVIEAPPSPSPPTPSDAGTPLAPQLVALTSELELVDAGTLGPPTLDGGRKRSRDKRFGVRWDEPGLCDDLPRRRAELLSRFVTVRRADTQILRDPAVSEDFANAMGESLLIARRTLSVLLGPRADVAFPDVYVYESVDQLRSVACVNTATAGYYDGSIHVPASDPDAHRTVVHELTHHVLRALGVQKPMWFHEGLAMYAADERWWSDPRSGLVPWLQREHLPFSALTEAFPHTADELFAGAVYFQSFEMVRFLGAKAGRPDFAWFAEGLANGTLNPQTAFGASLGLDDAALEREWQTFVRTSVQP
ncbi:MAG: hypothetical protein QM817_03735 [Archangium sp.]